jgi:hypothetical protein
MKANVASWSLLNAARCILQLEALITASDNIRLPQELGKKVAWCVLIGVSFAADKTLTLKITFRILNLLCLFASKDDRLSAALNSLLDSDLFVRCQNKNLRKYVFPISIAEGFDGWSSLLTKNDMSEAIKFASSKTFAPFVELFF